MLGLIYIMENFGATDQLRLEYLDVQGTQESVHGVEELFRVTDMLFGPEIWEIWNSVLIRICSLGILLHVELGESSFKLDSRECL